MTPKTTAAGVPAAGVPPPGIRSAGPGSGIPSAGPVPYLDAAAVMALTYDGAADAIVAALAAGLDVAADPPRAAVDVTAGQLLLMPAEVPGYAGVKLAAVAPRNTEVGLPRIQASYLLLDGATLAPLALIDGTALTTLRTPAVSAVAARALAPHGPCRLVVFGGGPQALGHVAALRGVAELSEVVVVTRTPERAARLAAEVRERWRLDARAGTPGDVTGAAIVVCATTAARPLFPAGAAGPGALVIAVGSHQPGVLELEPALLARSQVVVEDPATARREAGEVVAAVADGLLDPAGLVGIGDLVTGAAVADPRRTRVFKSVGMGWEDLVVAVGAFRRHQGGDHGG